MKESQISLRGKVVNGIRIRTAHEVLYGCIKRLSKKNEFCWAMNETLSALTGYTKGYVSHLVTDLYRIGWVYRRIEYAPNGEIEARVLVPLDKLVPKVDVMEKIVEALEAKNESDGTMNRLRHNGRMLGINPEEIKSAVYRYGAERIDELLAIINASASCKSPRKFFYAGLKDKPFTPSARAKHWVGKWFTPKPVNPTRKWKMRVKDAVEEATRPIDPSFLASLARLGGRAAQAAAQAATV